MDAARTAPRRIHRRERSARRSSRRPQSSETTPVTLSPVAGSVGQSGAAGSWITNSNSGARPVCSRSVAVAPKPCDPHAVQATPASEASAAALRRSAIEVRIDDHDSPDAADVALDRFDGPLMQQRKRAGRADGRASGRDQLGIRVQSALFIACFGFEQRFTRLRHRERRALAVSGRH